MISHEEYKKALKQFHKLSDRHILAAETDMSSYDIQNCMVLRKTRKNVNILLGSSMKCKSSMTLPGIFVENQ